MSDAIVVAVAKEVTGIIAGSTFSQSFTTERSYLDWALDVADEALRVDIATVSIGQKAELDAREVVKLSVQCDICVRKKLDTDEGTGRIDIEQVDGLMLLVQEIYMAMLKLQLQSFNSATWELTDILVCPDYKHIREWRQFTGIVRTTFLAEVDL